jgi:hypothetical protein
VAERMLITKVKRTDATQADLYAKGHRFPDLKLFDLGELGAVGIDFEALPIGQETPARFWAYYELSAKTNKAGNPYKDVLTLEPIDRPASAMSTDNTAILSELRRIAALLEALTTAQGLEIPEVATDAGGDGDGEGNQEPGALDAAFPRYGDGTTPDTDNVAEVGAFQEYLVEMGRAPASVDGLRTWYAARQKNGGK